TNTKRELVDFVNEFFQIGGFEVDFIKNIFSIEEAFEKFTQLLPQVVVFCSPMDNYSDFVLQLAHLILKFKPLTFFFITEQSNKEILTKLQEIGMFEQIYFKSDILSILNRTYQFLLGTT
ncbi:MAG: hypothetical protein ACK42Z_10265, partial [Candidatus Kapaibacteriota bacterium]